jgi:1-acyl-sn-glycerol-3-phosphate acyltransferase
MFVRKYFGLQAAILCFGPRALGNNLIKHFHSRIILTGRQAQRQEAPILVCAPHTSWLDPLVVSLCRSSPVAREEQRMNPVTHACGLLIQDIFVDR